MSIANERQYLKEENCIRDAAGSQNMLIVLIMVLSHPTKLLQNNNFWTSITHSRVTNTTQHPQHAFTAAEKKEKVVHSSSSSNLLTPSGFRENSDQ